MSRSEHHQQQTLPRKLIYTLVPAIIGCLMLCASFLPWLKDPLGETYTAWNVPIDIGWQFSNTLCNYGLLCICCTAFAFFMAYEQWKARKAGPVNISLPWFARSIVPPGVFCSIPLILFLWQYLFVEVQKVDVLAQHDVQLILIKQHLGYSVPGQILSLSPFAISNATFVGRLEIVINHLSVGFLFVGVCIAIAFGSARFFARPANKQLKKRPVNFVGLAAAAVVALMLLVVFGRAPAALVCEYQAKQELAIGDYNSALQWLNTARGLNPALEQAPYYHREQGQAWLYLHPGDQSADSHVYLAFVSRGLQDYQGAYQELLAVWQSPQQQVPTWIVDEMSITLEQLSESQRGRDGLPQQQDIDVTSLPWLQTLSQVDHSNIYGTYLLGRIYYVQHSYDECLLQMQTIIHLSHNPYVLSSAYTYMAFSIAKQGNAAEARQLLATAVQLDPYYHNNTAREELSGLH
ncbi:MAG TPA: hypothetical protein VKR06_06790 [Ktedonosporobacter sp.]|nr:hypothetical protein [Ktedonosporobacter sp.]